MGADAPGRSRPEGYCHLDGRDLRRRQADAYAEDLIEKCQALADGAAPSKDCRRLVDPSLPENLRYARSGQHYVVFIAGPTG